MTKSSAPRPISVLPEVVGIVLLASLSLAPLILSSGAEMFDWLLYHQPPEWSLLRLEPLVGLDAWLHWTARLLIVAGLLNVALRRIGPLLTFRRRMAHGSVQPPRPGTPLHRIATRHGCLPSVRMLVSEQGPMAFTAGLIRPRTYISESLLALLEPRELELLLLHEMEHCRARDPARSLFTTLLADQFFWLPAVRTLEERVISKIEFGADDAAARLDRAGLAQTILKVASLGSPAVPVPAVPFTRTSRTAMRVRRLIRGGAGPVHDEVGARTIRSTIVVLVAIWALGATAHGTHHAHLLEALLEDQRASAVFDAAGGTGVLAAGVTIP